MRASEFVFHSDVNPSPPGKCLFVHHSAGTRHPQPRVEPDSALQSSGTCGDLYGCAQPICLRVWVCTTCVHTCLGVHSMCTYTFECAQPGMHSICTHVFECAQPVYMRVWVCTACVVVYTRAQRVCMRVRTCPLPGTTQSALSPCRSAHVEPCDCGPCPGLGQPCSEPAPAGGWKGPR